jgi:uncharacterized protein DUF4154
MALLRVLRALALTLLLFAADGSAAPDEYRVKAVFLFNFSRFVEWPDSAFAAPDSPFVIGVFGHDPFGPELDEVTNGESVNGRPLQIRRVASVEQARDCQILFIPSTEQVQLDAILAALDRRSTLTVSDLDGAATRGAMIRLVTDNNRIRLRVNVDSARAAGLTISSKLLRSAEIVSSGTRGG